jgi:hypothetical protein
MESWLLISQNGSSVRKNIQKGVAGGDLEVKPWRRALLKREHGSVQQGDVVTARVSVKKH